MSAPTSRFKDSAEVQINAEKCRGCGLCVQVCADKRLELFDGRAREKEVGTFGCIACGHCEAVCPHGAVEVRGRDLDPGKFFELPPLSKAADYGSLLALLERRRSVREFRDKPVPVDVLEKILAAAANSPMGIPPSDVNVLVLHGRDKTRAFAEDYCQYIKGMRWLVSRPFLTFMRPFWGRETDELFRNFVRPMLGAFLSANAEGKNFVTYDAPLALYFYGTPYGDPADPSVAATVAMYAAESLGLGTCMIGSIHPMIQKGGKAAAFRKAHGIRWKSREGLFVLFGYPKVVYRKGIHRNFASVDHLDDVTSDNRR